MLILSCMRAAHWLQTDKSFGQETLLDQTNILFANELSLDHDSDILKLSMEGCMHQVGSQIFQQLS